MALSVPTQTLYDQLCALPDTVTGEILDGELIANPRPMMGHAVVLRNLLFLLQPYYQARRDNGPSDWIILSEVELHLGADVIVPDLSGWRRARMPAPALDRQSTLCPDWVCEIHSPATRSRDLGVKRRLYRQHGVAWYWMVDPAARSLTCQAADATEWREVVALTEDARGLVPPFDDRPLALGALWDV